MKLPEARANKPLSQALGSSFATAKTHTLQLARHSAGRAQCESVEQSAVWLRAHCEEFVARAEKSCASIPAAEDGSCAPTVFDSTRLFIVDKFESS